MKRQHPSEFIYHPLHNMPALIPLLPACGHINNVCAKAHTPEKAVDTEIPETHNPWGLLWKAFPSISSNQLPSCVRSGYIIICSFALKIVLLQLDLRPQYSPVPAIHWRRELQHQLEFHNSTVVFTSVSLYRAPRVFSTAAHSNSFCAATQQSPINALWHPIRENAS